MMQSFEEWLGSDTASSMDSALTGASLFSDKACDLSWEEFRSMKNSSWLWPGEKRIAVVFNVCLEAWSDGKAPGISPMGNPLPPGVLDTMAISWAEYGVKTGIYRLLDAFKRHGAKTSVMVNAVIAERAPEAVKAIAEGGHEVLSHSYAMDVIPALLSDEEERGTSSAAPSSWKRCRVSEIQGWLSPRGTSKTTTPKLLAEAGYRWYGDVFDADLPYVHELRRQKDRRDPALLRRQRHAVDEIRQRAQDDA